jgi:hypothetical protein
MCGEIGRIECACGWRLVFLSGFLFPRVYMPGVDWYISDYESEITRMNSRTLGCVCLYSSTPFVLKPTSSAQQGYMVEPKQLHASWCIICQPRSLH